ncbi:very short patch repair endonuclease [Nitratidesulfovibrio sp. D1]|uniref:very short patch repair endonuclease n=1 Tax=Nitratidesulfovibrio sp. D1 TaxID=3440151 RepID=UPI003EBD172B
MADVLTPEQRRLNMSRIHGRDTRPELLIRRGLHKMGFRFRLHRRDLPGSPDVVFTGYRTCLFVHGCFWHGHDCVLFKLPATRTEFWQKKIENNRMRDAAAITALLHEGWRVVVIWECALKGPGRIPLEMLLSRCSGFLKSPFSSSETLCHISGATPAAGVPENMA